MNKKSNITERINNIIDHYNINANELALRVGGSRTKVYNALNGKSSPGYETLESILQSFPDISAEWLIRGEGAMIKNESVSIDEVKRLRSENQALQILIRSEIVRSEVGKTLVGKTNGVSNHPQVDREGASDLLEEVRRGNMRNNNRSLLNQTWRFTNPN